MSGVGNPALSAVTDHQKAEARAHVELLRSQRENPLPDLEQLQRELPQNSTLGKVAAYINFSSSRLESFLPIVSSQIYTSVDSVVLELIQNADDAKYNHAQRITCTPYLNVILSPAKVVLEYNEDGFTHDDVDRICDINNSNKGENDIGEKGIGFKSVFMIASKVQIESREYSFSFKYKDGDKTSRMFTPEYEASDNPPDGCTRITLTLLEDEHIRRDALRKFKEVPTTLLLFLRHIKKLTIFECLEDGTQISAICTSYEETGEQGVLKTNGRQEPDKKFLILSKFFDDIHTTGEKRKNPKAEVKLAFPLTPNNTPLIEKQQDIFARLPIGSTGVGFHFLVHSDFSTSANREAVDEKSKRNADLLKKIAELFQVAVKTFCNSPYLPLRHQWMEFLPDNSISSTFWSSLRVKIESNLAGTRFLRSGSGHPDLISHLRYVPEIFRNGLEDGKPLFPDLPDNEKYLHSDYEPQLETLTRLGLKELTPEDMLDRVKMDAESKQCSIMRTTTDEKWHTCVAKFLLYCKDNYPTEWKRAQALPLIPIFPATPDNWTSISSKTKVYYPAVDKISVPTDLEISLVTADAAAHPDRKRLFKALKVDDPPIDLIRQYILKRYQPNNTISQVQSLAHLRFLWWTHPKDNKHDAKLYGRVHIFNKNNSLLMPLSKEIFFDSDDQYGVQKLFLGDTDLILHHAYLAVASPHTKPGYSSWKDWLRDFIGVQEYPHLADRNNPEQLSPIFERISKDCPDKVVGLLQAHWSKYKATVNDSIRNKVSSIEVPSTQGDETAESKPLQFTVIPTPTLIKACETFAVDKSFPFLDLPSKITDCDLTGWDFLSIFGVNKALNLKMYLRIMLYFRNLEGNIVQERAFKLYLQIQCQCVQAESYEAAQETVRAFFNDYGRHLVFVPNEKPDVFSWKRPEECLWDAPTYMQSRIPLLARYRLITDATIPTEFFQETLLIRNTTAMDLLGELEFIARDKSDVCRNNIKDIYVRLNAMRLTDDGISEMIRDRFEFSELIWIQSETSHWQTPSYCLWSSKAQITYRETVSGQYGRGEHREALEAFFVDCLKVTEPTLELLAEELQLLAQRFDGLVPAEKDVSVGRVKIVMEAMNSLPLNDSCPVRENLRSSPIFPVRWEDGSLRLESAESEFSIRDRENYWEAFNMKVPMLDFTLEEVNELGLFLRWMGLERRYLSNRVTERSEFSGSPKECSKGLTKELRFRALSLFRCAVHFKSPRIQGNDSSLSQLLSSAKVYQTSGISTYLDLSQTINGKERTVTVRSSTSKLHIEQKSKTELRLFVPSDDKQRFLCYCKLLPERLMAEVFMKQSTSDHSKTDTNAARVLAAVLNAPQDEQTLEYLLTEFGIRGLPDWCKDDIATLSAGSAELEMTGSSDDSDDEGGSQTSVNSFAASASSGRSSAESADSDPPSRISQANTATAISSLRASQSTGPVQSPLLQLPASTSIHPHRVSQPTVQVDPTPEAMLESQNKYINLLGRIRDAARKAKIPVHGAFDMSSLANAIEDQSGSESSYPIATTAFGTRSLNQLRHDMKVGAAGELFVYELLKHLPTFSSGRTLDFNESNWPSSIRDYVRVHPACRDEFPECIKKREQADIIFDDKDGDFTEYLIDKLYLDEARYRGAKPKYFIEVKSTLKECKTKFYMSKSQHGLMHKTAAERDDMVKNVYLIFRVFYLDTQDIGLRIYSDPGELRFVEESYTVTPKVESE